MHTILGAGGSVATHLTKLLIEKGANIRLVSRNPITPYPGAAWSQADLLKLDELKKAAEASNVLYVCAGLKYDKRVWADQWPKIMKNVIDLAKYTRARLIFFDNVYTYGRVSGPMTETTPYNPTSMKGEIRATIATMLMKEAKAGNIRASIARSADFYAGSAKTSVFDMMVVEKFKAKQKAMWLGNPEKKHSFTYVPDAAKAMFMLGQNPDSDNEIWHVPTAPALTGLEMMRMTAEACNAEFKYTRVNKFMLRTLGLFNNDVAESVEMYYQNKYDYIFDSTKFETTFKVQPTSYREGIGTAVG